MPTQSQHHSHGHAVFPWPQLLVVVAAFLLLLYGLLGFRYSGLPGLLAASGELLGIGVDPLRDRCTSSSAWRDCRAPRGCPGRGASGWCSCSWAPPRSCSDS